MEDPKYVILVRNPSNGQVLMITRKGDGLEPFNSENEAADAAKKYPICRAWPWCVVEAP